MLYDLYKKKANGTLFHKTDIRGRKLLEILSVLIKYGGAENRLSIIKTRTLTLPSGTQYQIRASLNVVGDRNEITGSP